MSDPVEEFFKWADEQRQKHRVMTMAEYQAWLIAGDAISDHTSTNPFPGGLTIRFNKGSSIIGRTLDDNERTTND